MLTVNKSQVSLDGSKLVTEASTVGLAPGEWPDFVAVVDDAGEGFLFGPARSDVRVAGELVAVVYHNRTGAGELHILND